MRGNNTPNARLSECVSALLRHERGLAFAAEEMSGYGVLDDFCEDGYFNRASDRRFDIIESFGFTWESLWRELGDRLGWEVTFEQSDWTGERVVEIRNLPYSVWGSEWFHSIPDGSPQHLKMDRALANTP